MKLNLNAVLDLVKPQPVAMELDGKTYVLRRLSIADVRGLEMAEQAVDGDDEFAADQRVFDHCASLFDGDAPPPLRVKLGAILDEDERLDARRSGHAMYAVINQVFVDQRSKTYALAQQETSRQISGQRATSSAT